MIINCDNCVICILDVLGPGCWTIGYASGYASPKSNPTFAAAFIWY